MTKSMLIVNPSLAIPYNIFLEHDLMEQNESEYWVVSKEIMDWFHLYNIKVEEVEIQYTDGRHGFGVYFENEESFVAFKLRWL